MASGKSTAVSSTKKTEMPSTPRYQCTPRLVPVYSWSETSWNPPSCTFIATMADTAMTRVTRETMTASA